MATGSLMMGTLKGKLGETVALRRSGKQVLRAYVRDVKNPNSQKQQVQRMVQSTVAQAYSAMKKICDHSFEGVQVGQKSMSYFMSKNMDKLRASIVAGTDGTLVSASADFVRKGVNLPVLNKYIVGKGTLAEVTINDPNIAGGGSPLYGHSLLIGRTAPSSALSALNDFINENNGTVGDWFTFLLMLRENNVMQNGQQVYKFAYVRFVVDEVEENDETYLILRPSLTSEGVPSVQYSNVFVVQESAGTITSPLQADFSQIFSSLEGNSPLSTIAAYSIIHSRQNVGGSWQRSNAEFTVRSYLTMLNITWPDDFFAELATYAGSAEAKGQGDYVLNGGQ